MGRWFLTLAAAFGVCVPAGAQLLGYEEILNSISGKWLVPIEIDGETIEDCRRFAMNIWNENENGELIYYSSPGGSEVDEYHFDRSPIFAIRNEDGTKFPALLLKYDEENRKTDDGKLYEWRLFMLSEDSFVWQATHWPILSSTPVRTRCPEGNAAS